MKILHLLSGGGIGGIEILCRDIADLSNEKHEFCFLYSGGAITKEMQQKGACVYFFYTKSMMERIKSLVKLVKDRKYDAVIVHHEGVGIYTFYLILTYLCKDVTFIKYLHCSFEDKYFYQGNKIKDWLNYQTLRIALERSDSLIAVSEFVKRSYCDEFGCNKDKVKVVYNGIRIPEERETSANKSSHDNIRLLYIGRLVEVKGVRLLLQAVSKLQNAGVRVELDILGEGPQRTEYEQLTKELEIDNNVYFHGQQLQKQVFYDRADIFIYPSIWQEAFGISIVEAMAQGKLCVASISGGIPEIIEDGKDGFLFEIADADSLVEVLKKAISICNTGEYDKLSCAARQKAKQFDIYKMIEKLQEICR